MAVLQRSTRLRMPMDDAERCWNEFTARLDDVLEAAEFSGNVGGNDKDPGTVYFTKVDDRTTEVTIQLDPTGTETADEAELNQRVDAYLDRFKEFVEAR